jgi:ribosomal protein S18 acetylase RimI-like enzyme
LFVSRDAAGRVTGTALVQVMPGALGIAWPSKGEHPESEDLATRAACDWLRRRGVKICQAFATGEESCGMASLLRNGFQGVTQLVFLQRDVDLAAGWGDSPRAAARCFPLSGRLTPELNAVLLATHEGTLDCPELNTGRTPEEVLAGFSPGRARNCPWWHTVEAGGLPVGALLFDQGPQPFVLELSYLGLVPAARGRNLGNAALAFANQIAANAGYQFVSVSVDARNEPALKLYRRHGFVETEVREVYLAQF